MDELCEIITWAQIGIHKKPVALLNAEGFFDQFMEFIKHSCAQGFILPSDVSDLIFLREPGAVIEAIQKRLRTADLELK